LSPIRVKNFLVSAASRLALGPTQPPFQLVLGAVSLGVKWLGREDDCSPPTSAEVRKRGSLHPLPHMLPFTCRIYSICIDPVIDGLSEHDAMVAVIRNISSTLNDYIWEMVHDLL
jgi:hypothetical protein